MTCTDSCNRTGSGIRYWLRSCAFSRLGSKLEGFRQHDQDLADAVTELCLSGNESPLPRVNVYKNEAFVLAIDSVTPTPATLFNAEAFRLLSDILGYLHRATDAEKEQADGQVRDELINDRERLECRYLQKLCQIVLACPFDYEFLSVRTNSYDALADTESLLTDIVKS